LIQSKSHFPLKYPFGNRVSQWLGILSRVGQVDIQTLRQAIIVGSSMASFNVEDFSCDRLKRLTHSEIEKRVALFKKLSHFEEIKL
jgi:hypothetical protein